MCVFLFVVVCDGCDSGDVANAGHDDAGVGVRVGVGVGVRVVVATAVDVALKLTLFACRAYCLNLRAIAPRF